MNDLKFIQLQKGNQKLFEMEPFNVVHADEGNIEFGMDKYMLVVSGQYHRK